MFFLFVAQEQRDNGLFQRLIYYKRPKHVNIPTSWNQQECSLYIGNVQQECSSEACVVFLLAVMLRALNQLNQRENNQNA
jgi:hypothetical protein